MEQVESSNNTNNSSSPKEQMSHPKSALATAPSGQQKGEFKKVKSKEVIFQKLACGAIFFCYKGVFLVFWEGWENPRSAPVKNLLYKMKTTFYYIWY